MSTAQHGHQAIGHILVAVKNCLTELADPSQEVVMLQSPEDEFRYVFVFLSRGDCMEVVIGVDVRAVDREYLIRLLADTHRAIQQLRRDGQQKVLAEFRTPLVNGVKQASAAAKPEVNH